MDTEAEMNTGKTQVKMELCCHKPQHCRKSGERLARILSVRLQRKNSPADPSTSDFQAPDLEDDPFLLVRLLGLCFFVSSRKLTVCLFYD